MSDQIELEFLSCAKCGLHLDKWTMKAEVVNGVLSVRCPHCREIDKLVLKIEPIPKKEE